MKKIIVLTFILISFSFAIFEDLQSGARSEGMGGAFTAVADDASAIQFNPAGLNQIEQMSLMSYYKLLFGGVGANLHNVGFNFVYPLNSKAGVIGVSLQEMGISLHSEKVLTVSHGFNLIKDIAFGYNLHGYALSQQDFGSGYTLGIDFGLLTRIYKRWQTGFFIQNINKPKLGATTKYSLPVLINFGVAYRPTYGITSTFDISKEVGKPTRILLGQEFQIIEDYLTVRAGLQTEPIRFTFGFRTGLKNINLDYAMTTHPELPLTHTFGVLINLGASPRKIIKKDIVITQKPEIEEPSKKPVDEKTVKLNPIYFDYDKSDIRPSEFDVLQNNAQVLKENLDLNIIIEGHCCPIGTSEYNMALGWRRANATKDYLIKLGIKDSRISIISYGEEKLVTNDEIEFWKNRRCEFIVK